MTQAQGFIDRAARHADALPLARIVAVMLGGSTAFFCLAMPRRLLDPLLSTSGIPLLAGPAGRILFAAAVACIAASLGWLMMRAVGAPRRAVAMPVARATQGGARKRPIGPVHASETLAAPPPPLLVVRRGDAHPDAPPRRPLFAHYDLGTPPAEIAADAMPDPDEGDFRVVEPEPAAELMLEESDFRVVEPEVVAAPAPAAELVAKDVVEPVEEAATIASEEATAAVSPDEHDLEPVDLEPVDLEPVDASPQPVAEDAPGEVGPPLEMEPAAHEPAEPETFDAPPAALAAPEKLAADISPDVAAAPDVAVPLEPVPTTLAGSLPPAPVEAAAPPPAAAGDPVAEPAAEAPEESLASLMARLEGGMDRIEGTEPPAPAEAAAPFKLRERNPDDALREALEALQRMASRQR